MAKFYEERAGIGFFSSFEDSEVLIESARILYNSSLSLYNQGRYEDVMYFLNRATGYLTNGSSYEFTKVRLSVHSLLGKYIYCC